MVLHQKQFCCKYVRRTQKRNNMHHNNDLQRVTCWEKKTTNQRRCWSTSSSAESQTLALSALFTGPCHPWDIPERLSLFEMIMIMCELKTRAKSFNELHLWKHLCNTQRGRTCHMAGDLHLAVKQRVSIVVAPKVRQSRTQMSERRLCSWGCVDAAVMLGAVFRSGPGVPAVLAV